MRIKICGITSVEDARLCVEAGADALGFIFVERTPRYIAPDAAARIIAGLPPFVTPVGVFWDHAAGHVKAVAEQCGLGALQFHGDETPEDLQEYRLPVIKTLKVAAAADLARMAGYRVSAFLLDSPSRWSEGEARPPIPWEVAAEAARFHPVLLSAGLTPENVAGAVRRVRPYGVDVNSGVEARPGRKDPARVRRFVAGAREAAADP
jgi:phosphoribosylanthranilate isomerase